MDRREKQIKDSWDLNAEAWINAINSQQIESRIQVTNKAIVDVINEIAPSTVLDLGCGEGWLCRALADLGIAVTGIDATDKLINNAEQLGGATYLKLEYENISNQTINKKFDAVVCNFSLLGQQSVELIFSKVPELLNDNAFFVVQTLHPINACGEQAYVDGWRNGSWQGFSHDFSDPAPWYFRTLQSWIELFSKNDFCIKNVIEPIHPVSGKAASVIILGQY